MLTPQDSVGQEEHDAQVTANLGAEHYVGIMKAVLADWVCLPTDLRHPNQDSSLYTDCLRRTRVTWPGSWSKFTPFTHLPTLSLRCTGFIGTAH